MLNFFSNNSNPTPPPPPPPSPISSQLLDIAKTAVGITIAGAILSRMAASRKAYPAKAIDIHNPAIDLVQRAFEKKLDPVHGRDKEIAKLMQTLLRKDKPNVLIVGKPGTGKTALVEGFAQKIAAGTVPKKFQSSKVLNFTMTDFREGMTLYGQEEERMKQFLNDIKQDPDAIVFIDEMHAIAEKRNNQANGIQNMLKPALARGEIRLIGATTNDELAWLSQDLAFMRRFEVIHLREPSKEELINIVKHKIPAYEKHYGCSYTKEALEEAIRLSNLKAGGAQPDKVFTLLDNAGSRCQMREAAEVTAEDIRSEA